MARPVWTGTISFGMVSLPVRLVPAVRRKSVSFNQLDADTMSRIRYRKVSEASGDEVPADRIVRAANVGGDQYVVIDDDELAALSPERSKEIVIDAFVPASRIDPLQYDSSYHVTPDANAKPYALLANALGGTERVGIGRFVMRQREHVAAIRSDGRRLQLSTMVFGDELVDADDVEEFEVLDEVDVSDRELEMAKTLVEAMSDDDVDTTAFVDEYRTAVEHLIEQKAAGETPVMSVAKQERGNVIDLAEALEASLEQAMAAKQRHPSAGTGETVATPRKPATKKVTAKKVTAKQSAAKQSAAASAKKAAPKKVAAAKRGADASPRRKSA